MIKESELINKYPQVKELKASDKAILFKMMNAFQEASQETIDGGEQLLKMCDGCAFKKGSDANNYPTTVLTATECVINGEPFYCHKRFSKSGQEKLCNGWINIMNNK